MRRMPRGLLTSVPGAVAVIASACLLAAPERARSQDTASGTLMHLALASTPNPARGEQIYLKNCKRCHDAQGSGTGSREFPQLSGQQETYLLRQLVEFVTQDRYAPKMHRLLVDRGLSDAQSLRDLSAYLATQPHNTHGEHGDGYRLGRGRQIYDEQCANCHGRLGEGVADGPVPSLSGQNYTYLLGQLQGFTKRHRSKADPAVIDAVRRLSSEDQRAAADFLSRLPQSADPRFGVVPH